MRYNYHVYNQDDIRNGFIFGTYFQTQKEAKAYAATIKDPIIKRKIGGNWVRIN